MNRIINFLKNIYLLIYFPLGLISPILYSASLSDYVEDIPKPEWLLFSLVGLFFHCLSREVIRKIGLLKKKRNILIEILFTFLVVFYWLNISGFLTSYPIKLSYRSDYLSLGIKQQLIDGIKECIIRDENSLSTKFYDVPLFKDQKNKHFKIIPLMRNNCLHAKAVPIKKIQKFQTWFELDLNKETGKVSKTCGDSSKQGCEEGNTW